MNNRSKHDINMILINTKCSLIKYVGITNTLVVINYYAKVIYIYTCIRNYY